MARGSRSGATAVGGDTVDEGDDDAPGSPDGTHRKSLRRGPLTAVACEACRKRKSKCDGVRPICSTCQSKDLKRCVYEAGLDGSRIQQLRKHNQHLQSEVASLQTQLRASRAENESDRSKWMEEQDTSSSTVSSTSDQRSGPPEFFPFYTNGDLETRFQEIRAGHKVQSAFSKYQLQGFLSEGLTPGSGWSSLHFSHPIDHGQQIPDTPPFPLDPTLPPSEGDDSPISKVYSSFRSYARQAILDGEAESRVLGSFEVNAGAISSNSNFENASYLSQWAGQVVSAWGLQSFAPKIGMMYLVFKLMRWQVSSSQQDFNDLPEIMKPTATQICVPHPPFIDFLIWPLLRDLLISESATYSPLQWTEKIAQTLNLTRDFSVAEVLYGEPSTGHFRMHDAFRVFVEDVDHWTLDPVLVEVIPQLRGKVMLR